MGSSLTMVEARLPPGFRFHPRDDELVCDYLINKSNGSDSSSLLIEVDLNKCEPWDIPETVCVGGRQWYFYSQRDRKYATGLRTNRATASGYWKATGKDRPVVRRGSLVGMRKTLVFYRGRAPKGNKTNWVMHEFRVEGPLAPPNFTCSSKQEDWVLCRVLYKKREMGWKSEVVNDEASSSTVPPPLMVTFDQTTATQVDANVSYNQQVPCFSISSSSLTNLNQNHPFLLHNYQMQEQEDSNNNYVKTICGNPILPATLNDDVRPLASQCDRKALEAVLTHLTNDSSNLNLGELANSESYLSQVALPHHTWNHY